MVLKYVMVSNDFVSVASSKQLIDMLLLVAVVFVIDWQ